MQRKWDAGDGGDLHQNRGPPLTWPSPLVSSYNFSVKSPSLSLYGHQVFDEVHKRLDYDDDEEARVQATKEMLQ